MSDYNAHTVKVKWQGLRDTFRKENAKLLRMDRETIKSPNRRKWKYYDQLTFLNSVRNGKPLSQSEMEIIDSANFENSEESLENNKFDDFDMSNESIDLEDVRKEIKLEHTDFIDCDENCEDVFINFETTTSQIDTNNKRKHEEDNARKYKIDNRRKNETINKRKSEIVTQIRCAIDNKGRDFESCEEIQDEDYHFVMSLLPHLRDIPKKLKLDTRIRLQQILLDVRKQANK